MRRSLAAAAVIAALLATGISAPAQASNTRDLFGAVAGGLAFGVIAHEVKSKQRHRSHAVQPSKHHKVITTPRRLRHNSRARISYINPPANFGHNRWHGRNVGRGHFTNHRAIRFDR